MPLTAFAQDISTETSDPVTTSTIDNGSAADITITEDGSIELGGTEGQVAVTMDSDNHITHNGIIQIDDTNSVTGILLEANRTGDLTMGGEINLVEDYTREDLDDDEDDDGALALGADRVAIRLAGGGTHTGDISLQSISTINVEGNASAAILLQSELDGTLTMDGIINVIGEDAVAIQIDDTVTGDVLISGNIITQGTNARGVDIGGDVEGNVTVESTIATSGFTNTGISNYVSPLSVTDDTLPLDERIDADDLNDNGPTFAIGGNLAHGLLINGAVDTFISEEDEADETKDTIDDFDENRTTGILSSTGSGAALLISPDLNRDAAQDITLGTVIETVRDTSDDDEDEDITETLASFTYDYGLINRGAITANGLNVGYAANAVRIEGSEDGLFTTQITGGMLNTGTINAEAFEADAIAMSVGAGARLDTLENSGDILATISAINESAAHALLIEAGATLPTLTNSGVIRANTVGESGSAYAIRDLSNGLSEITNTGVISAFHVDDGTEPDIIGETRAIDLSTSTIDVSLIQSLPTPTEDVNGDDVIDADDVVAPAMAGDILFGSGDDTFVSTSGSIAGDTSFGLGNATMNLQATDYEGDVTFSDGDNTLSITGSSYIGDVSFGGDNASFDLSNSIFTGQLISDGTLDHFEVAESDLHFTEGMAARLASLSITGDSRLTIDLDPNGTHSAATLTVADTATLGDGVTIRPDLQSISSTDFTYTIIDAGTLIYDGSLDQTLIQDAPFIYAVELVVNDDTRDTLDLEFNLKSAEQLGLDLNQSAAYDAVLEVFSTHSDLGAALAEITEEDAFLQTYDLLLPQRTDAATRYLSSQASAAFGALGNRMKTLSSDAERPIGFWAQEYFTMIDVEADTDVPGYNGSGLGFAAGLDSRLGFLDIGGLYINYSSGDFEEKTGGANPVTTSAFGIGLYAKDSIGALDFTIASQISTVDFNSRRELDLEDITYTQRGDWAGTSMMTSASVSSVFERGQFYARPHLSIDYFQLQQDGYSESGDEERLALELNAADTDRTSASAVLDLGARLPIGGRNPAVIIPEVSLGYRGEIDSTPYTTTARFLDGEETFDILAQDSFSDALLAGISLSTDSVMGSARIGYDVELAEEGLIHFGGATLKLKF
ncbi:MAG: autotransporter outer membrane beta-barrel domain-containing protein [Pseudomonadota bacterium]